MVTLRSPSRGVQWTRWLMALALAVCAYVVIFRGLYEGSLLNIVGAMQLRVLLPVLAVFGVFAYETRWDGVVREGKSKEVKSGEGQSVGRAVPRAPQLSGNEAALNSDRGGQRTARPTASPQPQPSTLNSQPSTSNPQPSTSNPLPGEVEYALARRIPHQPIPDYALDGEYLKLLARSAAMGYPRALAKLGDYAMRRGWTVEAYYWLWRAKKGGMGNLDRMLMQVRSEWANRGFRRESANESQCFSHEQGTIGYALLCIDARHNADSAKSWLTESAPDFLSAD